MWSPDSQHLAVCSYQSSVIEILPVGTTGDAANATIELATALEGHTNNIVDLSWNTKNGRIASASIDGTAKIWDPVTGEAALTLTLPVREPLQVVAWSPNGERLLTVSETGVFVIWDASEGYAEERLRELK